MAYASKITRFPELIRFAESDRELSVFFEDIAALNVSLDRCLLVSGERTFEIFGQNVKAELESHGCDVTTRFVHNSTSQTVDLVVEAAKSADVVVAVGGGKVIDVGKMAAFQLGLPFISIPTVLSNDGIASPISVIDGKSRFTAPPMAIFIDLEVVARAPIRHLRAGVGDLIANLTATLDWELAHAEKGEPIIDMAVMLARNGALMVFPSGGDFSDKKFLMRLAGGLIQSGLAMEISGSSRPASGAEHKISHAIDALYRNKVSSLHGEQTALGLLISGILHGLEIDRFLAFFEHFGLPMSPSDIGLNDSEFVKAIAFARTIRPERFTILEALNVDLSTAKRLVKRLAAEVDNFRRK